MGDTKRYLGLELAGAKNQKTSIAVIEFYPKERKVFLLDIYDRITTQEDQSGDEALLELIQEVKSGVSKLGVNVPLDLPPCITCTRKTCPMPANCTVPSVKWMKETHRKAAKVQSKEDRSIRLKDFTPYTQRPIELWIRYQVFPELAESYHFDIDETLGGNRAPLTARMSFIKRHLHDVSLIEVWPKLSTAILATQLGLNKRIISTYRQLEDGVHSREEFLSVLSKRLELFIYERDLRKLSNSINSFDAFICALTALLSDENLCVKPPKGFPTSSGWVQYPELELG